MQMAAVKARLSTRWTSARSAVDSCRIKEELHVPVRPTPQACRRRLLATALGVTAVLAVAASAAQARPSSTNLSLVAYSTPGGAFSKIIPAFQKTAAGKDVTFKQSYGASGPQAGAVAQRTPGRRREPLARPRRLGAPRRPASSARPGTRTVRRHGHRLDRRVRRPRGQSEEHQDVGRPDQARHPGHQPEPVHLGRRALERHGGVGRSDPQLTRPRSRPTRTSPRSTRTSRCRTRAPAHR